MTNQAKPDSLSPSSLLVRLTALRDQWRKRQEHCSWVADLHSDPYGDYVNEYRIQSAAIRNCADEVDQLLTSLSSSELQDKKDECLRGSGSETACDAPPSTGERTS